MLLDWLVGIFIMRQNAKKKRNFKESKTQAAALEYLKVKCPAMYETAIKIDNEGKRSIAGVMTAYKTGLHKGASDLFFFYPTICYNGMFLEVKPEDWKLTPSKQEHYDSQIAFIKRAEKKGYYACLAIGIDECIRAFDFYLST